MPHDRILPAIPLVRGSWCFVGFKGELASFRSFLLLLTERGLAEMV